MAAAPQETSPPPVKPTFEGRLKLQEFMFKAGQPAPSPGTMLRRSPRHSTLPASPSATALLPSPARTPTPRRTASAKPSASPSPSRKRKAATEPALPASTTTETEATTPPTDSVPPSPSLLSRSSSTSTSTKKKKRRRPAAGYAPPSTYAHLPLLPDAMAPNLLVLFVGLNPGVQTALTGHAYAHPSNLFWKLMLSSGVLPVPVHFSEDRTLPRRFALGLTNIVARPSRNGAELSKAEMDAGVAILEEKVRRWRPEAVCVVGKSIWESVWRVRHGRAVGKGEFRYGWQEEAENMGVLREGDEGEEKQEGVVYDPDWKGARVFVASSTSGLAATLRPPEKERIWRELGAWVERRRAEREAVKSEATRSSSQG
ncbi:G/U mismatch-specific uracil DNA glycosylase [Pleurostoma richardsiae]|uniref:G/U mismatch-specific uracil DNA glycosylase n=1 Tax=Pleurostoma richardsiae TaxID=41990 RepID=A0AA38VI56_9PEZI|nr:G/U mismatch-specific uracil DNA glycosylase [Pleurostoma richardsiae]